jgi:hypothetical protein
MRLVFLLMSISFCGGSIMLAAIFYICTMFYGMAFDEAILVTVAIDAALIVFNAIMALILPKRKNVKTVDKRA